MPVRHLFFAATLALAIGLAACSDDNPAKPNPPRVWERVIPVPDELPDLRAVSIYEGRARAGGDDGFTMVAADGRDWRTSTAGVDARDFVTTASSATFSLGAAENGEIFAFGTTFIDNETFDARWRAACGTWHGVLVVGDEGKALFTDDGRALNEFTLPTDADLTDCVRQHTYFVSDEDGYIWEVGGTADDPDFTTWTTDGVVLDGGIRSFWITRESSRLMAVGADGALYRRERSEVEWTHEYSAGDSQFRCVNDGYAVGDGGLVVKGDGLVWNRINLGTAADLRSVARHGNVAWIVGINGTCFRSDNTVAFTQRPAARPIGFTETHWTGETYVIGGYGRTGILLSEDGERWRRPAGTHPANVLGLAGNGSRVVATTAGSAFTSDDLETWIEWPVAPTGAVITELVWTGARYVGAHDFGLTSTLVGSVAGEGFRPLPVDLDSRISNMAVFRGEVILSSSLGHMLVLNADDEITERPWPNQFVADLAVQGDYLYAVGMNEIWRTHDLEAWLPVYEGDDPFDTFTAISGGRGMVALTGKNTVFESNDGVTWTGRAIDTTHRLNDALWGSNGWVLVGEEGAIYVD